MGLDYKALAFWLQFVHPAWSPGPDDNRHEW